ncbi:uncharacterized protein SAPINGB_P000752 [Magnusiomyces paraingens]|uniref:N-acetyltransferase domain-containing protein n=1 Tax=Magnusiomyces paraingens TaxID=2606893 RepID=A0A5E8B753_9ASCO|nr:uncharacterized protein SAPINGB_P000752 [Saprochaete ingens]VVT45444.1 unnamed protein product [Saprochaete ingens]
MTIVRLVTASDKPQWLVLWKKYLEFYASTGNKAAEHVPDTVTNTTFSRFLDDSEPMACLVAEDESSKTLVGFAHILWHRNTWAIEDKIYLNDLYVDENIRCGGVGRKLIEAVYKYGDEHGMPTVYWRTQEFNHRAQLLYTKVGIRDGFLTYKRP